jgi:hypothetical protein
MAFYLKGEAGKALDATFRRVGSDLVITNAVLEFENLGVDRLSWMAKTIDLEATETILPDVGQMVELYQGTLPTPTRYFRGWVTSARAKNHGTVVTVEGPAQWLRKMTIDTSVGGDTRPQIQFAQQSVATSIAALVNRAIALGAPIALGTVATMFTIPAQQISMVTFLDVLAELVRWVPDAVVWWDYSGTGTPALNVWRRAGLTATAYGAGAGTPLTDYDVTGRGDLVPSRVEIKYQGRAVSGVRQYLTQADGSAAAGRVQVIGLSGEEMSDFLPTDDIESYQLQTTNANQTANNLKPFILARLPEVIESRSYYSGQPTDTRVTLADGESVELEKGSGSGGAKFYYNQPPLKFTNVQTGLEESRVGKSLLITADPPDWLPGLLGGGTKVRVSGRIYRLEESTLYTGFGVGGIDAPAGPAWAVAFPWSQVYLLNGYYPSSTVPGYPWARVFMTALDFEFESYLVAGSYPALSMAYKPQDFQFNAPPTGLAATLRGIQNFTPYEGNIILKFVPGTPPPTNHLSQKISLTGVQSHLATMDAMVRRATHDLGQGITRIELGAPARFAFDRLTDRIHGRKQSNITL